MPAWFTGVPMPGLALLLVLAGTAIVVVGVRFTAVVDHLADRTHLGEAITGAVFMGATTSLPDIVVSTSTAASGYPEIAVSNAVGGIAVQTAFLAVADITYRRANLEHAAASLTNILEGVLLVVLLTIPLMAMAGPALEVWAVHPASVLMFVVYGVGLRWALRQRDSVAWKPAKTEETVRDEPERGRDRRSMGRLWMTFGAYAVAVVLAGYVVAQTGVELAERTGLTETAVGAVITALVTSSGELVTSIAAVQRGALTLAVGGVIGGNTFDTLLVALSDFFARDGSIYQAIGNQPAFLIAATLLMTAILLMGLLTRQKHGWANIGFESALVLAVYGGAVAILLLG